MGLYDQPNRVRSPPRQNLLSPSPHQTKPNQIKPNQTKPNQTRDKSLDSFSYVRTIDPDAPLRESKDLDQHDQDQENRLLEQLWRFIRCGKLDEAKEFCRKSDQFWRSASLSGSALFDLSLHPLKLSGNDNRFIYLKTCKKLSELVRIQ